MSMQKVLGALSIACALTLAACDEEEGPTDAGTTNGPAEATDDENDEPESAGDSGEQPMTPASDAGSGPQSGGGAEAGVAADAAAAADGGASLPTGDAGAANGPSANDGGAQVHDGVGNAAVHFFLPTGEPDNTSAPSVEVDAQGNVHSIYPAYAGGDAYYSFCASDGSCTGSANAKVVHFLTDGTVANAMLALTKTGKPRVLLSTFQRLYWAACEQGCSERQNWSLSVILEHAGKKQVSGEALALDAQDRPRFLMHTYRALFGIGQEAPEQTYAQCDAGCENAASWRYGTIEHEIWEGSQLRFDAQNRAHVATTVIPFQGTVADAPITAYLLCDAADCSAEGSFRGTGFVPPYESMTDAVSIYPSVSLALTKSGAPRVALLGKSEAGKKQLLYFACEGGCKDGKSWTGTLLTEHDALGAGLDLALDASDHPRLVYTFNYNILLRFCDSTECTSQNAGWDDALVESSSNIPADNIFLWENCTIGAWFLHDPSIALTADGLPRVGYQARDVSGGFTRPDPTRPGCTPGTDMTFARLALPTSVK